MPHDVVPERNEADRIVETLAGQRPPLSCRTSPPQGGRSAGASGFANQHRCRSVRDDEASNLPPFRAHTGQGEQRRGHGQSLITIFASTRRPPFAGRHHLNTNTPYAGCITICSASRRRLSCHSEWPSSATMRMAPPIMLLRGWHFRERSSTPRSAPGLFRAGRTSPLPGPEMYFGPVARRKRRDRHHDRSVEDDPPRCAPRCKPVPQNHGRQPQREGKITAHRCGETHVLSAGAR